MALETSTPSTVIVVPTLAKTWTLVLLRLVAGAMRFRLEAIRDQGSFMMGASRKGLVLRVISGVWGGVFVGDR